VLDLGPGGPTVDDLVAAASRWVLRARLDDRLPVRGWPVDERLVEPPNAEIALAVIADAVHGGGAERITAHVNRELRDWAIGASDPVRERSNTAAR
jgi:hypothetical protein